MCIPDLQREGSLRQEIVVRLRNGSRTFTGRAADGQFRFTEAGIPGACYQITRKPNTQEVLEGFGALATGNPVELALLAQVCAAFDRHVMEDSSLWAAPPAYYRAAPANYSAVPALFRALEDLLDQNGLTHGFRIGEQRGQVARGSPGDGADAVSRRASLHDGARRSGLAGNVA